jgi:hypothetical protein
LKFAAVNKFALTTFNTKDFKHFQGLSVVDWCL